MHLIILAGPNGSGKSTIANQYVIRHPRFPYVNADYVAKALEDDIPDKTERLKKAWHLVNETVESNIKIGKSFIWETVCSHSSRLALAVRAQSQGFKVEVIFISTIDSKINIRRVAERVSYGGHDVPKEKIQSRYDRCIRLLPDILTSIDFVKVYDNSWNNKPPLLIFEKSKTVMYTYNPRGLKKSVQKWRELHIVAHVLSNCI